MIWNIPYSEFIKRFLRIILPYLLLLIVAFGLLYKTEYHGIKISLLNEQKQAVELATQVAQQQIQDVINDARFLVNQSNINDWITSPTPANRHRLEQDLIQFASVSQQYDQLRLLDNRGHESVRINWLGDHAHPVAVKELQDKSHRQYWLQSKTLQAGEIYLSPLNLNKEHGKIEYPLKPVIRVASPVYHFQQFKGMLILNFLAEHLLDQIQQIGQQRTGLLWLVNRQGKYLIGPGKNYSPKTLLSTSPTANLSNDYPVLWQQIQTNNRAQQWTSPSTGFFTVQPVFSGHDQPVNQSLQWFVVAAIPADAFATITWRTMRFQLYGFAVILLFTTVLGGILAQKSIAREIAEQQLRENEKRYKDLLQAAPDGILIVDTQGNILIANEAATHCFGYSNQELRALSVDRLLPDSIQLKHSKLRQHFSEKPVTRNMGEGKELLARRKDGSEFPIEVSLSPRQTAEDIWIIAICRDVTTRKKIEQAKHRVQQRYQSLVSNLPVGVFRCRLDPPQQFIEANQAMRDMFAVEPKVSIDTLTLQTLFCTSEDDGQSTFGQLNNEHRVIHQEMSVTTLQGAPLYVTVQAVLSEQDGIQVIDGIIEDISLRHEHDNKIKSLNRHLQQRSQELEIINSELEAFSYSVSHDLRAPLRALNGFSHTLLKDYKTQLDERGVDRLQRINKAAHKMGQLIDDLLILAKVSRTHLVSQPIDLTNMAVEITEELHQQYPELKVSMTIAEGLTLRADPTLTRVLLTNLISNAWKFSSKQSNPKVTVGYAPEHRAFFVRDNGVGFNMDYGEKLFSPFQRLHSDSQFPGSGIGLATVQRIVNKHGGQVWASSQPQHGATFYFCLDDGNG